MAKKASSNKVSRLVSSDMPAAMPMKRTREDVERERKYRAEDAMRTLTRAKEIQADKALMRDVKRCAQDQMKQLQSVVGSTPKPSGRR